MNANKSGKVSNKLLMFLKSQSLPSKLTIDNVDTFHQKIISEKFNDFLGSGLKVGRNHFRRSRNIFDPVHPIFGSLDQLVVVTLRVTSVHFYIPTYVCTCMRDAFYWKPFITFWSLGV